jgi:hypothetical protein
LALSRLAQSGDTKRSSHAHSKSDEVMSELWVKSRKEEIEN